MGGKRSRLHHMLSSMPSDFIRKAWQGLPDVNTGRPSTSHCRAPIGFERLDIQAEIPPTMNCEFMQPDSPKLIMNPRSCPLFFFPLLV